MLILDSFHNWKILSTSLFLKSNLIWNLNLSKSEIADFIIILDFEGFSSKTCKYKKNTKTKQNIKL